MRRAALLLLVVPVVTVSALVVTAMAVAAWQVQAEGTAGARIASLPTLTVQAVTSQSEGGPGSTLGLYADVHNDGSFAVTISGATMDADLTSGDATCDASLVGTASTFSDTSAGTSVPGGQTVTVHIGNVTLPENLDPACAGRDVTAPISVQASS